ncbi:MAG: nitrophenyl compound nitroreductase subunit ArsF family protein [Candidatus Woesearchaeota archaeon]
MSKLYFVLAVLALLVAGCSGGSQISESAVADAEHPVKKLEVYHFHGTHQCYSCITVGDYAEETVKTYFADELASGKIVFGHINGELPENRDLVVKYGVTSASLWLGTYTKDGNFSAEQNTNVWYKISNKQEYMNYLKGVIEQKLAGK